MPKISVLHLISPSAFLGAERVVCELASGANQDLVQVRVGILASQQQIVEDIKIALEGTGVEVITFPCKGKMSVGAVISLADHLRERQPDIVHSHGYKSDIYAYLASKIAGSAVRMVATNHTWKLRTVLEKVYKIIDIRILRRLSAVVAVSIDVQNEMIRYGINDRRVSVIYNGVSVDGYDGNRTSLRRSLGVGGHEFVVGCVASLTVEKAHKDLIRAFASLANSAREARLVLIGDGPERQTLVSLSESLGVKDKVIFAGHRQDVKVLYGALDVFALVSYAEGLPMAMLEAMAASLPVVVTPVGAIPQVVTPDVNGFLISPGDHAGLAEVLLTLHRDLKLRQLIGKAARNEVVERYSVKRVVHEYELLYKRVLEGA